MERETGRYVPANDSTVLVTGASGYIAGHCILQLLQQGYCVRGTLRDLSRQDALWHTFNSRLDVAHRLSFVPTDLGSDDNWDEAMRDCRYVLHVASPNAPVEPRDETAWLGPARDGTLRVLRAAAQAGVQRVVMTSSDAAIRHGHNPDGPTLTEADWSKLDTAMGAYVRSKTVAERAAWDFVEALPSDGKPELVVINPTYTIGPLIDDNRPASVAIVGKLLNHEVPGCVRLGFNLVDVRDVANAHLCAMTDPRAVGQRFICTAEFYWMHEIARVLDTHFAHLGYRIPTRRLPDFTMRFAALYDKSLKRVVPEIGKRYKLTSARLRDTLGWRPRPVEQSIIDTAESLIELANAVERDPAL